MIEQPSPGSVGAPLMFVTWFHADDAAHAGTYSQIRGSAASSSVYETYLRCVDVCVASLRRWNPSARCVVVLNPAARSLVTGTRAALWERLHVDLLVAENRHQPDVELFREWQNQFFLFDVMDAAASAGGLPDDAVVVVDSDVVVRGPLGDLADAVALRGRLSMRIPYGEDEVANGSSRSELRRYATDLTGRDPSFTPAYQGGEFVAARRSELSALVQACQTVYEWSLRQQREGRRHPNEEAHMISVAAPTRESDMLGNAWIERIWTKPWNLRLLPAAPDRIPLWHLPAEKKTGFRRLHAGVVRPESWFWHAPRRQWLRRVDRIMGVPRYGPGKLLRDVVALRADIVPALRDRVVPRH